MAALRARAVRVGVPGGAGPRGEEGTPIDPEAVARYLRETAQRGDAATQQSGLRARLHRHAAGSQPPSERRRDERRCGELSREEARVQLEELVSTWGYPDQRGGWLSWALANRYPNGAAGSKAGAVSRKKRKGEKGRSVSPSIGGPPNLLDPETVRSRAKPQDEVLTDLKTNEDWEQAKLELILDKLASSTVRSYSLGWRWWALFCRTRGLNPSSQAGHGR